MYLVTYADILYDADFFCKPTVACRLIKDKNRLMFIQNSIEIHMKVHKYEINWFQGVPQ